MGGTLQKDVRAAAAGKGLLADAREIIESARAGAYRAVNAALVQRNWLLGKRIAEEEFHGERAAYGRQAVKELAEALTEEYGNGFSAPALYQFVEFYRTFPILDTLCIKSGGLLGWSHYRVLLQVKDAEAREWYKEEAGAETWSVRTLQRNISSQYYERTLLSQSKGAVKAEMRRLTGRISGLCKGETHQRLHISACNALVGRAVPGEPVLPVFQTICPIPHRLAGTACPTLGFAIRSGDPKSRGGREEGAQTGDTSQDAAGAPSGAPCRGAARWRTSGSPPHLWMKFRATSGGAASSRAPFPPISPAQRAHRNSSLVTCHCARRAPPGKAFYHAGGGPGLRGDGGEGKFAWRESMSHPFPKLLASTGPRGLVRMDFARRESGGTERARAETRRRGGEGAA